MYSVEREVHHRDVIPQPQLATPHQGEPIVKLVGCGLILLACTSSALAGERYVEIWNPPEARGGVLQGKGAPKPAAHKRRVPHLLKTRAHHMPATSAKLAIRPGAAGAEAQRGTPNASEIPRLITPEGNVLRVGTHDSHVEVVR
jgi:hypothetical protein